MVFVKTYTSQFFYLYNHKKDMQYAPFVRRDHYISLISQSNHVLLGTQENRLNKIVLTIKIILDNNFYAKIIRYVVIY